jgi:HK97 family phage portal protein
MRIFGFEVTLTKAAVPRAFQSLEGGGWSSIWTGGRPETDFQRDIHTHHDRVLSNWTVFACMTAIAGDIGKMRIKLMEQDAGGIWQETTSNAFSPVLRKPNDYQTRQKFLESWIFSKLSHGNAYILKERDNRGGENRGVVTDLYVLDPCRVTPLTTADGEVFYRLNADYLSGVTEDVYVPASEIIHDRMWCLFHPLVGLSPIYASGLAATQGLRIQANSARFFENMSRPSGILTSPVEIADELAKQYQARWDENFGAGRIGKTAVLGGGLKYETLTQNAVDSQLVEQLKMSAEMVCSTFHVPAYKVGVGTMPTYQNAETLNQIYYDTCLQPLIEAVEALLDEGLGLGMTGPTANYGTELDLDALLRMDKAGQTAVLEKQVGAGITSPNEARAKLQMQPVTGGNTPYLQQQNFGLEALAKRDSLANPFVIDKPTPNPTPSSSGPASTADPAAPMKGIETMLEGLAESQNQLALDFNERLAQIDKRFDEAPGESEIEQHQVDGAQRFVDMLKRRLETEPAGV